KTQAEDIKEKNKKLESASKKISHLEAQVEKLEEESSQKNKKIEKLSKQLTDSETQNENLKNSFYLDNKPLSALPVKENKLSIIQNIFKQLKTKAKVKF
ncbi:3759_t:CDS:1, partial [Funneliformis caledonium]